MGLPPFGSRKPRDCGGLLTLRDLSAGMLIPLTFFERDAKVLFYLPFQFITYVPTRVFIGHYELAGISLSIPQVVGLQFVATLVMLGRPTSLVFRD